MTLLPRNEQRCMLGKRTRVSWQGLPLQCAFHVDATQLIPGEMIIFQTYLLKDLGELGKLTRSHPAVAPTSMPRPPTQPAEKESSNLSFWEAGISHILLLSPSQLNKENDSFLPFPGRGKEDWWGIYIEEEKNLFKNPKKECKILFHYPTQPSKYAKKNEQTGLFRGPSHPPNDQCSS